MKYGYMTYANLRPEWFEKMDELPAEMDRFKEHAEKHGFHMKYWGHPYGTSENIVAVFKSEKGLGDWLRVYIPSPDLGDVGHLVVNGDLEPIIDLDSSDDIWDVDPTPESMAPELGPRGFEIGHDGGVVDVALGVDVAPSHLDFGDKRQVVHDGEGSTLVGAAVASAG